MALNPDLKEFIALLNANRVEYVVVGAHALAFHGHPRFTGDLDIAIAPNAENLTRLNRALNEFGFPQAVVEQGQIHTDVQVVQLGVVPNRVDLLFALSGLDTEQAVQNAVEGSLGGLPVRFLQRDDLVKNKRATDRPQDRADIDALECADQA